MMQFSEIMRFATFFISLFASVFTATALYSDEATKPRLDHVLRIQMTVEYKGKLTEVDDLIYCGAREKGTLTRRPVSQVLPTRYKVTEKLQDDSAVTIDLSWKVCSFKQSQWRAHISPENEYKVPEGYTPMMRWRDSWDPTKVARVIRFLSEEALYNDDAFIRIVSPVEFSVPEHPPSDDLIAKVFREDDRYREQNTKWPKLGQPNPVLVRIPETEWRNVEKYRELRSRNSADSGPRRMDLAVSFLETKATENEGLSYLYSDDNPSDTVRMAVWEYFRYHQPSIVRSREEGIPRRTFPNFGTTGSSKLRHQSWTKYVFPLACTGDQTLRPLPQFRGTSIIFRRDEACGWGAWSTEKAFYLEIDGQRLHRVRHGIVGHYHRQYPNKFRNDTGDKLFEIEFEGRITQVPGGPLKKLFFDSRTNEILLITR